MHAIRMVVAVVGVSVVASPLIGQDDHPAAAEPAVAAVPDQPTATAIIERFIEATGGRAGWESLQSLRGLGSLEIVGANVGGSLAIYQTRDGFRMSVDAGPAGAQVTIRRGDEAWQVRPDGTTTVVTGGALRKLLRDRSFNPLLDAATLYTRMELVGVEDVNGEPAWKIRCIPSDAEAAEELRFFGVASGLQVKVVESGTVPGAAFPTEIFLSDYRQVGSVKVAFGTTISFARSGVQITLEAMQANVAISECLFAPPAGPVAVPEAKQESPKETLKAFMAVDLEAMNTPEVVHWLSRLDAAKRAIDPSDPDADATRKALSQFHRMCIEKVRGGAAASP